MKFETGDIQIIKPGSLTEHLYVNSSMNDLEKMLLPESNSSVEQLSSEWELSIAQCKKQIEQAVHYIKHD